MVFEESLSRRIMDVYRVSQNAFVLFEWLLWSDKSISSVYKVCNRRVFNLKLE